METNDYHKTREVLTRVHEFLGNLCKDARCDNHCSECIGASDLADDVYDLLHTPPRNCEMYDSYGDAIRAFEDAEDAENYEEMAEWLFAPATEQEGGDDGTSK